MRNLVLLLCLGCSSGNLLVVTADSNAPLDVERLHAGITQGGVTRELDVPLAARSIPPAHTFGVTFVSPGHVKLHLEAFAGAQLLAAADGEVDVSGRSDLTLQFQILAPDLGAADLADLAGQDAGGSDGASDGSNGDDGGDDGGTPCGPGTHSCGGVCLASSDVANCGASCTACPVPLHASAATCDGTSCGLTCETGYHDCNGNCVYDGDPANCGVSCTPCAAPSGGTATCDGTQCGGACPGGKKLCAGDCIPDTNSCQGMCAPGFHDCGGLCADNQSTNSCGTSCTPCPLPANAQSATCDGTSCGFTCKSGYHQCGLACLSDTDVGSCGTSCTACAAGPANSSSVCVSGACDWQCNGGFKKCGAACIPTASCCSDPECAGGSHVSNASCVSGACQITMCASGFSNCDGTFSDGCELNLSNSDGQTNGSINHCGSCSGTCATTANATGIDCVTSSCHVSACAAGRADCNGTYSDGCELNTSNSDGQTNGSINHCGSCGTTCTATSNVTGINCVSSQCHATSCSSGTGDCDGSFANGCEANLTNSDGQTNGGINHCGACGSGCPFTAHVTGTSCTSSACKITSCASGFADCDGVYSNGCEVNTNTDVNHCGLCITACGFNSVCNSGSCGVFKRVFVTSQTYNGNLGMLAGADTKCQTLANAAGLGGTYKAWLSSSTISADSRMNHYIGQYGLVDRTLIAGSYTDLVDGNILHAINLTELGSVSTIGNTACDGFTSTQLAWTGTTQTGASWSNLPLDNCNDWTSSVAHTAFTCSNTAPCALTGTLGATNDDWSSYCGNGYCSSSLPLYCFEQ